MFDFLRPHSDNQESGTEQISEFGHKHNKNPIRTASSKLYIEFSIRRAPIEEMDHGNHSMGAAGSHNATVEPGHKTTTMMMHMTFFWGSHAEVLFAGWPGTNTGMYVFSLMVIFAMAVLMEWISNSNFIKQDVSNRTAGVLQTLLHGLRMGLAYLVMLAVMSFNVGVFLAVVGGHVVGFLTFGSRFFKEYYPANAKSASLPPMSC
ncbi:unnamed protein product [Rhodiola kirilowii]